MRLSHSAAQALVLVCVGAAYITGCVTEMSAPRPVGSAVDACADRLHEICGPLLLYYSTHERLPGSLQDLRASELGGGLPELKCPVSGHPYAYNPRGLNVPGYNGKVVIYDTDPAHDGMRWGVTISESEGQEPLVVRVVLIPEKTILKAESGERAGAGRAGKD